MATQFEIDNAGWADSQSLWRSFVAALSLMMLGSGISGCTSTTDLDWQEQVQLSDGRIIIVERELTLLGGAGRSFLPEMGTGKIDEERIRFPGSAGIDRTTEWHSTKRDYLTYPEIPLIFELDSSGQPIIFTIVPVTATASPCAKYSKYIYRNGVWTEEPLPERFHPLATNLWLARFPEKRYVPKLLTLEEKRKLNPTDEYAPALRQVGPTPKACGEAYIR